MSKLISIRELKKRQIKKTMEAIIICNLRFIFCLFTGFIFLSVLSFSGSSDPISDLSPYWVIYISIADIFCLIFLSKYLKNKGIKIKDLYSKADLKFRKNLLVGIGLLLILIIPFMGVGIFGESIFYPNSEMPQVMQPLPLFFALYSVIIWAPLWSITEDLFYFGAAYPELKNITTKKWIIVFLIAISCGLQHTVLPIIDFEWACYRFITAFFFGACFALLFLKVKRLTPLHIAHTMINLISAISFILIPSI